MKKFIYQFRSIMVNNVEKVVPGTVFTRMELEMDENSVAQHTIELSFNEIIKDSAWILYFFLSFMSVAFIGGLIYGLLYIGLERMMEPASWNKLEVVFLIITVLIFLVLWIFLSFRGSVEHLKREFVEKERGNGNWRIVDEDKWETFHKLLMISKRKKEQDLEKFLKSK